MIHLFKALRGKLLRAARQITRALRLVWQAAPGWTAATIVLLFAQGLLPVVSLYLMKLMLDAITAALGSADPEASFQQVVVLIAVAGGVALANILARDAYQVVSGMHSRLVIDSIFHQMHGQAARIDLEFYENAEYYDVFFRAKTESAHRLLVVLNGVAGIIQSFLSLLGVLWLLIAIHWAVVLILLVALVPGALIRLSFSRRLYDLFVEYTAEERRSQYYDWVLTGKEHAKEIRAFNLGATFMSRYDEARRVLRNIRLKMDMRRASWDAAAQTASTIAVFGSFALIAHQTILGHNTLGDLVLFYQAFQRGQGYLQDLLNGMTTLYENNLFLASLYHFLDLQPNLVDPPQPRPFPQPMQTGIRFEEVAFQYPMSDRQVLDGINLSINPGEVIALVGENGSGKTTLVKLLCRLYEPTGGRISIDGQDVHGYAASDLRKAIGVIFQDYAHYYLTARENIQLGNTEIMPEDAAVIAAARRSGAHAVITRLTKGYDTILGNLFESGEELSIGQWQKVALARAFLRDSQLIVLDEPTSALDPKAEYEVFKTFRELLDGRSAILISHRMSTVRMADRIYVLDQGRIIECGTHDELMGQNGTYASLFETQAQYYR
ncbi:MAG: ABC transporter ATP-binding protein/permease [Anaerolineae bacterium]|nr:ABC transporter ATP-binding protein/permease [Anaerolineae bacterium]